MRKIYARNNSRGAYLPPPNKLVVEVCMMIEIRSPFTIHKKGLVKLFNYARKSVGYDGEPIGRWKILLHSGSLCS